MEKISVIIQGELWPMTFDNAKYYLKFPFVDEVIISCWNTCKKIPSHENIKIIRNVIFPLKGYSRCNYQLVSTLAGVKEARNNLCVKTRSDMLIKELDKVYNHVMQHKHNKEITYLNGDVRKFPIFVIGLNRIFPFHFQDHFVFCEKKDMIKIFDIPPYPDRLLDPLKEVGFSKQPRETIYIGAYYCSLFDERVKKYTNDIENYLCDCNKNQEEVMKVNNEIINKIFYPLPRFELYWEKFNTGYWYQEYERQGEYYYEA